MIACGKIGARSAGPIGCSVCGFRYGAGGAGISGRMLYQRSGMSLSLSRIFLVTAPSLLNPMAGAPESVSLRSGPRPPTPVPTTCGDAGSDQLQARARAIGAPSRRLPASTLELDRPGDRYFLLGGGMQSPCRVVQVSTPESTQIRPAGQDDAVDVVVAADRSHRDGGNSSHVSDPVRKRGLVAAAEARLLFGDCLAGRHVDRVDSVSREGVRDDDRVFGAQPTLEPVDRRHPHRHRFVVWPLRSDGIEHL